MLVKTAFQVCRELFGRKFLQEEDYLFWKIFSDTPRKLSTGLPELRSKILLQPCEKIKFLGESQTFCKLFSDLKTWDFSRKNFTRVSKTRFHVFQEPFWSFFEKTTNKNVSVIWVKKNSPVQLKVYQVVETALYMPPEKMSEKKLVFFRKSRSISGNSDFEQKIFGGLVKTAFNVCREIFRGKLWFAINVFPGFFSDISRKNFVRVVKTAFHVSPKKLGAQKNLWKNFLAV